MGMNNSYHLFFELAVILICYSLMIGRLIIALRRHDYGVVKVQSLLLLIVTILVGSIYII